jgi:hypothetical protein
MALTVTNNCDILIHIILNGKHFRKINARHAVKPTYILHTAVTDTILAVSLISEIFHDFIT